jgi:hypothetical protein
MGKVKSLTQRLLDSLRTDRPKPKRFDLKPAVIPPIIWSGPEYPEGSAVRDYQERINRQIEEAYSIPEYLISLQSEDRINRSTTIRPTGTISLLMDSGLGKTRPPAKNDLETLERLNKLLHPEPFEPPYQNRLEACR